MGSYKKSWKYYIISLKIYLIKNKKISWLKDPLKLSFKKIIHNL